MLPLYTQFKEQLKQQEDSGYINLESIKSTFTDSYNEQIINTLRLYSFKNNVTDSPVPNTISGIAYIFKNSATWGWIFAIGNGRIFTRSLESGSWKDWKEFN